MEWEIKKVIINRVFQFKIFGRKFSIRIPYNLVRTKCDIKGWTNNPNKLIKGKKYRIC